MVRLLVIYLKFFDQPIKKALVDALIALAGVVIPIVFFVSISVLKELMGMPWDFQCFIGSYCDFIDWMFALGKYIFELILVYCYIIFVMIWLYFFSKAYFRRDWALTFIMKSLFIRITAPMMTVYFLAIFVNLLLNFKIFQSLDFIRLNWSPILASDSGLTFFIFTAVSWLVINYAVNKQAKIIEKEREDANYITWIDRAHELRLAAIRELESRQSENT